MSFFVLQLLSAPLPGDEVAERFRERFERAETEYRATDYGTAVALFREADRQRATPEVAFDLARCFEKLGDTPFATLYYRLYLRRAPEAPDMVDVAQKVGVALTQAEAAGLGYIEVDAPSANGLRVAGRDFPSSPAALFLPPGEYEVQADFPSGPRTARARVTIGHVAALYFEPRPPPLVPLESALSESLIARGLTAPPRGPSGLRVAAWVTGAVGVAALAAGVAVGLSSRADAERMQDRSLTAGQAQALADSANTKGIVANALFGGGGAAVAGGVLMFVFSMPEPGARR